MDEKDAIINILIQQRDSFLNQLTELQIQLLKLQNPVKESKDGDKRID